MDWAYGITTVAERRYNYLPSTITSLKAAGFDNPMVFVDGPTGDYTEFGNLAIVHRSSKILAFGNWFLALLELWIRNPRADRFAIFQDDFITYKNLKTYLENCDNLEDNQYWNLYTFPQNEDLHKDKRAYGWFLSNQRGRGAVALIFNNNLVYRLLTHPLLMNKPKEEKNPHRSIDGTVITAMWDLKVSEVVHYPTLIMHTGDCSSIGNRQHDKPTSFLGEDFDAVKLFHGKQD